MPMKILQDFIVFIKTKKLDFAVDKQYELYQSAEVEVWNRIENNGTDLLKDTIKTSFLRTLQSIEDNNAYNYIQEGIKSWEENQLSGNKDAKISFQDICNITHIQKKVLLFLVPLFTDNVNAAVEIATYIEELSNSMQIASARSFTMIQEKTNKDLINAETNFKSLFDNAHDLIHIIKPDGKILYVNNAWLEKLEYSLEELEDKSIYALVHEKSRLLYRQYRDNILNNGNPNQEVTITLCSKNNKEIIVQGFVSAQIEGGKTLYTRGIFRDITIQSQYEDRLTLFTNQMMEREENLQLIINNAPDAVIVINEDSFITLWNPKAEQIFGWSAEEVMGQSLSGFIVPERFREAHHKGLRRYIATGEAHVLNKTIELSAINKSGKEFYISLTISATNQGGKKAFVSFIRDISIMKENEIELEKQRKELEQSARELEQYTWLTSHDLREPLRKVLTFSDMLLTREKDSLSNQVQTQIKKIQDSGQRMNNLIQAVLNYSSLTDNSILYEKTDLNKIIEEVITDLELNIQETRAVIHYSNLPAIEAVPFQMNQLFLNLIGNAIKYRNPFIEPKISIVHNFISDHTVELSVSDNGSGFDMMNEDKIFKLFHRLENNKQSGTGIGLALCKKIVQNHKGRIWVKSTIGKGSTFFMQLPVKHS